MKNFSSGAQRSSCQLAFTAVKQERTLNTCIWREPSDSLASSGNLYS